MLGKVEREQESLERQKTWSRGFSCQTLPKVTAGTIYLMSSKLINIESVFSISVIIVNMLGSPLCCAT